MNTFDFWELKSLGGYFMTKKKNGICCICGKEGKLTFEHIPPHAAFNHSNLKMYENVSLTSFSILFARLKGDLDEFVNGARAIENLKDGDMVLILESCTHHAIEDDIGRVKIPNLLRKKTGKNLVIHNYAGHDFPDIKDYKLIIHCGACMTNRREVLSRVLIANQNNVPITNYGVVISYCLGILPRAIKIFIEN